MLVVLVVILAALVLGMWWATVLRRGDVPREAFGDGLPTVVVQGHGVPLRFAAPAAAGGDPSLFFYANRRCDLACCDTSDASCDRGCVCPTGPPVRRA